MSLQLSAIHDVSANDASLPGVRLLAAVAAQDGEHRMDGGNPRLSPIASSPVASSDYGDQQDQQTDYSDEYDSLMDEEED